MKSLLLVVLISLTPLQWTGDIWMRLDMGEKLAYTSGLMGGLLIAAHIKSDPSLAIHRTPAYELAGMLDLFYIEPINRNVPVPDAILLIGGKGKDRGIYR